MIGIETIIIIIIAEEQCHSQNTTTVPAEAEVKMEKSQKASHQIIKDKIIITIIIVVTVDTTIDPPQATPPLYFDLLQLEKKRGRVVWSYRVLL